MLKTKESKGITLIALIITIIVLLILAGVTINALSGNDSTPAKAQEATQKTDISSAKEDCILTATTAKTDALQATYVANNANKTIAQSVIDELIKKNNTNVGSATIEVAQDGTVTISTAGYEVIGTVDENGRLTFGEVETTLPGIKLSSEALSIEPGKTDTLTVTFKKIPDTTPITWTSSDTTNKITVSNGTVTVNSSVANGTTATITAKVTYNGTDYTKTCIVTVRKMLENAIDLGTDINGSGVTTDDWVLLYDGTGSTAETIGGYVYCILADYLPNTNSAITNSGLNAVSGKAYSVNIPKEEGNTNSKLVEALNHSTAWTPLISSTYSGISGVTVKGALTYTEADKVSKYNPESGYPYMDSRFFGYWLSTPVREDAMYVRANNSFGVCGFGDSYMGVLPVVKIPASAITLNKVNNVWKITVNP